MRYHLRVISGLVLSLSAGMSLGDEPIQIGTTPQLFLDQHIVDNTWTLRYKTQHVNRVFHTPVKHAANPLLKEGLGYVCVAFDPQASVYHLWYQTHVFGDDEERTQYAVAYARSTDGLTWERPQLGLHEWQGNRQNNIVIRGPHGRASGPWLLDVPAEQRRGYKYLMSYRDRDGTHLIGSHDGVRFDPKGDQRIQHLHSDTQNAIVYDPHRRQFAMYCRAKAIYRAGGETMLDTGESRRIARATSPDLWAMWPSDAPHVLLPDELDTQQRNHAFYGMPTTVYAGVFFGFAWPFRWNDRIHTELAWSRDGEHFERPAIRNRLVDYGPEGAWDDEMVFAGSWVEVGDEWRIYYAGWDGPHNSRERTGGLGLATLRREGFCSLRGPQGGGVVCTRVLEWPGGKLVINAAAKTGRVTVRVSDPARKVLPGFDHADCRVFQDDQTSAEIDWKDHSIDQLRGRPIRLEFFLQDADLYSFRATGP